MDRTGIDREYGYRDTPLGYTRALLEGCEKRSQSVWRQRVSALKLRGSGVRKSSCKLHLHQRASSTFVISTNRVGGRVHLYAAHIRQVSDAATWALASLVATVTVRLVSGSSDWTFGYRFRRRSLIGEYLPKRETADRRVPTKRETRLCSTYPCAKRVANHGGGSG